MLSGNKISAFVITYNEEDNIANCLKSLKWADEIVIVDSYSEDSTCEIARRYTDKIIKREFGGHVDQTRYASEQTSHPWIVWLDADERFDRAATDAIQNFFENGSSKKFQAGSFPRKTYFMGRWITHSGWYPKPKIRLWHRNYGRIAGDEPHPHMKLKENSVQKLLDGDILHYSYPNGMQDMVATSTKYARLAAEKRYANGRRYHLYNALLKPSWDFLKKYFLQLGLMDGLPGFTIAVGASYYRFMREIMMWEIENLRGN